MPIDRRMDKEDVVHIYNGILSAIKRNEIGSFVQTWMALETVIQSEVSQKEKNKYRTLTHIYGIKNKYCMLTHIYGIFFFFLNGSEEPRGRTGIKTQTY